MVSSDRPASVARDARHSERFLPEYKHAIVDDGGMEQQNDQPASELPELQRNLTLSLIEAAAAYEVVEVVVPDAYEGIKHAAKAGIEKIRGPKADPHLRKTPLSRP